MKVFVITADLIGAPDSCQVGVASSEKEVLRMCEEWLVNDLEVDSLIPDTVDSHFLQKVAEKSGYWLQWYEHEIDVLKEERC